MCDVQEFMQEFVRAERALYRRFAELENELWARFAGARLHQLDLVERQAKWEEHTGFESSELVGEKATAIATIRRSSHLMTRARYSLHRTEGTWRMDGLEYLCPCCDGSGFSLKGEDCSTCHGKRYIIAPGLTAAENRGEPAPTGIEDLPQPKQDIDGFMHEFLLAERGLYRQFAELEKEFWTRFSILEALPLRFARIHSDWEDLTKVETFNETELSATVIATIVRVSQMPTRIRFNLIQNSSNWHIRDFENECNCCLSKGVADVCKSGGGFEEEVCFLCHGRGWIQPKPYVGIKLHRGQVKL